MTRVRRDGTHRGGDVPELNALRLGSTPVSVAKTRPNQSTNYNTRSDNRMDLDPIADFLRCALPLLYSRGDHRDQDKNWHGEFPPSKISLVQFHQCSARYEQVRRGALALDIGSHFGDKIACT